jgi:orotate phosphoribosyltransferase
VPALTEPISLRAHLGDPRVLAEYLGRPGALRLGHFRLLSGLHSEHFLAFSEIAKDNKALVDLATLLTPTIAPWQPTAVLAPSTAGVSLGSALAGLLGVEMHLAYLDSSGRPQGLVGDPGVAGGRVLLVNDVVTTGQGIDALARTVRERGADVAGAAWFASRSGVDVAKRIDAPVAYTLSLELKAVPADECAACSQGMPLEDGTDLN